MVFLVTGRSAENIEKKKKTDRRKTLKSKVKRKKNEECQQTQIITIYIFGFKLYFARKHGLKKVVYTFFVIKLYVKFLCVARYFNIHEYTNFNLTEIYINRLSTTTQIFITMDYSILMSEKYFHFREIQKHLAKTFFLNP